MTENINEKYGSSQQTLDQEIDIRIIFSFLLRNKILISVISLISFFIACLYSLTLKKVWEGQFQIVLNSENNSQILNPSLSNLIGRNTSNNLKTQVGILESPSVLMPIYDFVIGSDNTDISNQFPFTKWKKNLDIELQRETSILNI